MAAVTVFSEVMPGVVPVVPFAPYGVGLHDVAQRLAPEVEAALVAQYGAGSPELAAAVDNAKIDQLRHIIRGVLALIKEGLVHAPVWLDASVGYRVAKAVGIVFDELTPAEAAQFEVVTKLLPFQADDPKKSLYDHLYAHLKELRGSKGQVKVVAVLLHNLGKEYADKGTDFVDAKSALRSLLEAVQTLPQDFPGQEHVPRVGVCNPPHSYDELKALYGESFRLIQVIQGQDHPVMKELLTKFRQEALTDPSGSANVVFMLSRPFGRGKSLKDGGVASPFALMQEWRSAGVVVIPSISHNPATQQDGVEVAKRMRQHVVAE